MNAVAAYHIFPLDTAAYRSGTLRLSADEGSAAAILSHVSRTARAFRIRVGFI